MKRNHFLSLAVAALFMLGLASCEKDEGKLPAIEFKTGAGYTSADVTAATNEALLVGIHAEKTEDKDVLKTFNVSVSLDGGADSTLLNRTLTSAEEDVFESDITLNTGSETGTQEYTFTVTNRDGLVNQVSLTVTVE